GDATAAGRRWRRRAAPSRRGAGAPGATRAPGGPGARRSARGGGLEPPITGPEPVVLPSTPPPEGDEAPPGSPPGPPTERPGSDPGREPSEPDDATGRHRRRLPRQVLHRGARPGGRHVGVEADLVGDPAHAGAVVRVGDDHDVVAR